MAEIFDLITGSKKTDEPAKSRWYRKTSIRYHQASMGGVCAVGAYLLVYAGYVLLEGPHIASCDNVGFGLVIGIALFSGYAGFVVLRVGILGAINAFRSPASTTHLHALVVASAVVGMAVAAQVLIGAIMTSGIDLNKQTEALQRKIKIGEFVDRMHLPTFERENMATKISLLSDAALQNAGILPLTCKRAREEAED